MQKMMTWIVSLVLVIGMSACLGVAISIDGDAEININEEHLYKAVIKSKKQLAADAYTWEVISPAGEYTLLNADSSKVSFTPLSVGKYTLKITVSKKRKKETAELEISVTKDTNTTGEPLIIDGHVLPPDPGEEGKKTLLGIDSNDNGVRDDVEIWVYTSYEKPIERAVLMQNARAYQIVIQEPEKALENVNYMHDVVDCESYWSLSAKNEGESFWLEKFRNYSKEIKPIQFNTAKRFLAHEKYNHTLSGGVYKSSEPNEWKSKCDFNASTFHI